MGLMANRAMNMIRGLAHEPGLYKRLAYGAAGMVAARTTGDLLSGYDVRSSLSRNMSAGNLLGGAMFGAGIHAVKNPRYLRPALNYVRRRTGGFFGLAGRRAAAAAGPAAAVSSAARAASAPTAAGAVNLEEYAAQRVKQAAQDRARDLRRGAAEYARRGPVKAGSGTLRQPATRVSNFSGEGYVAGGGLNFG